MPGGIAEFASEGFFRMATDSRSRQILSHQARDRIVIYVTADLAEVLLAIASEQDPDPVSIGLAVTPLGDLRFPDGAPPATVDPATEVFTHCYYPTAGGSVSAVFGMDLNTPAGKTPGIFLSHPDGRLTVTETDQLREVVLLAVPPWTRSTLAAFDRSGAKRAFRFIDGVPPEELPP